MVVKVIGQPKLFSKVFLSDSAFSHSQKVVQEQKAIWRKKTRPNKSSLQHLHADRSDMSGFLLVEDQKKRCSMAFFTALRLVLPIYDERTLNRINILSLGTTVIILNGKLSVVSNVSNHSALKSALLKVVWTKYKNTYRSRQ